jgi:hypothetical protein
MSDLTLEVENPGPIQGTFEIDLSAGPTLYELRGKRGSGKSTILSCLSLLQGHKVDITVHDGELGGQVRGFGRVVPISSRRRPKGELELETLDAERFGFSDLIDPPGKTAVTRDKNSIEALVSCTGVKGEASQFYELLGGQERYESLGIKETDDPVLLASRVQEALYARARTEEQVADTERGHAAAADEIGEDLDLEAESDAKTLQDHLQEVMREQEALRERNRHARKDERARQEARDALEDDASEYKGLTSEQASEKASKALEAEQAAANTVAVAEDGVEAAREALKRAESHLEGARREHREAATRLEECEAAEATAVDHERTLQRWKEQIESDPVEPVPEAELKCAEEAVQAAQEAVEHGAVVRRALEQQTRARSHTEAAERHERTAADLRALGARTFEVLAQSLNTRHIRIESIDGHPRLVVDHPTRGKTFFDRKNGLSDGERVVTAIREILPLVPSPGWFFLPQRTYQDIQPQDRRDLARYAQERGIYLFGAIVTDDDLHVVPMTQD